MSTTTDVPASSTTADSAQRLFDNFDFVRGAEAFLTSYQGAAIAGKGWFPILRLCSPLEPFFDGALSLRRSEVARGASRP